VLQQDQRIGNDSGFALRHPLPLQLECRSVIHQPGLFDVKKHVKWGLGSGDWGKL
jgi:hypothetical protein